MKTKIIALLAASVVCTFAVLTLHNWLGVTLLKSLSIYVTCSVFIAVSKGVQKGVQEFIDLGNDQ